MSASAAADRFDPFHYGSGREPGRVRAVGLSFAVHALLVLVIFVGVRFQSTAPQTVSVELWEPPSAPQRVEPPPPPAPPKVEPPPPPPEPVAKPDIAEKAPPPKPKPEPKKVEPPKPAPPKRDAEMDRILREQLAQEQAAAQERQLRNLAAREQASSQAKALATWVDKIRVAIRSRIPIAIADAVQGNPEAVFEVTILPSMDVAAVRMTKSSGNPAYDEAVGRAIRSASPLPPPPQRDLFQRELELRFRPKDK
ncbi:MAG: TonB C-terminal domain-containing protein [Betaproteobacteria bacterium]|nr:TonB C-terminal domain-containing protein [Betaproteobacteria bacterium]